MLRLAIACGLTRARHAVPLLTDLLAWILVLRLALAVRTRRHSGEWRSQAFRGASEWKG